MAQPNGFTQRTIERFFLLLVSVVLALLFLNLYTAKQAEFKDVPQRLADGTTVNLNVSAAAQSVKTLLQKGFYFEDPRDVQLTASMLAQGLKGGNAPLDNIGALNKKAFYINAEQAVAQGGESAQKRVRLSRSLLGFSGADSLRYNQEKTAPLALPAMINVQLGSGVIKGMIENENGEAAPRVLVRLTMLLQQDSLYSNAVSEAAQQTSENMGSVQKGYVLDSLGRRQLQSLVAYARTDANGQYQFEHLPQKAFEVTPLQPGFQFGPSKGTENLEGTETFSFRQEPHRVRLLSPRDFNNLKREKALIVRTPEAFNRWFWIIVGGFFLSFLALHLFLSLRLPAADGVLLPIIMLLTGFSFLTLLHMQDALRDRFLAKTLFGYFSAGIAGIFVLLFFNLRRFTTDSRLYRLFFVRNDAVAANGLQWAAGAGLLLLLTVLFGSGPEGSGVKVNLLGFQPSEVVKYLTVIFLAGFFATNEKAISEYVRWQRRWSFFRMALLAVLATIFLFLIVGDLGPAIVCCFTFIVLFSFSRGDFGVMAGAVVGYALLVWAFENVWIATGGIALLMAAYSIWIRKGLSESAVMAIAVLAAFLLLDRIPLLDSLFPGPVGRLVDRKAIWTNAWDNDVFGGDHVAGSIWAIASGGLTGQGSGNSFPKTIPEAHTDMILPAMGEVFGFAVMAAVCLLFLVYLHRSLLIGRQTGTPFFFYLCAGVGVSSFIQFLLIAGGSTGALPLSGVSLPLVSYGGSSLVCNLLAAGVLLSASSVQGTAVQMKYLTRQQDKNLMPALVAGCAGLLLLLVNIGRYSFGAERWIVEPALVADRSGARQFSYNPRIQILMNRLEAGSLYDRAHRLLATSHPERINGQQDSLVAAGLEQHRLELLQHRRQQRYYPFGEHLFFWTGDANTGIFSGGNNGYFAEYRHDAALRGFSTEGGVQSATARRYRENRFLPATTRSMTLAKQDYAALAPMLIEGINGQKVAAFKKQNRDVQLSIDAGLQTRLQQALQGDEFLKGKRVSIVVLEDSTGDVLASAVHPLPPVQDWEAMNTTALEQQALGYSIMTADAGFTRATQPGSTAKLATALAAFNKMGGAAANKTFLVRAEDRIRVRSDEPDETGTIGMERALVKSNNVYFIRLANEEGLENEMTMLYQQTGLFLRGVGGYFYQRDTANVFQQEAWHDLWQRTEFQSRKRYDKSDIRATRGLGISGMAWGQGELVATPAAVARLASGIANDGVLVPHRFVLKRGDSLLPVKKGFSIARDMQYARLITGYMQKQSAGKRPELGMAVAGKTGTPERLVGGRRINDGWYVFFAPAAGGKNHVVVCVRIEECKGSSKAVKLAGRHVIPALRSMGYLKSFEQAAGESVTRD